MEKKGLNFLNKIFVLVSIFAFLVIAFIFVFLNIRSWQKINKDNSNQISADTKNHHIIVTGTYDNKLFLEKLYKGAKEFEDFYNTLVELHVPQSEAEFSSIQDLFDYCSFVNADGVIAYIDNPNEVGSIKKRIDGSEIPLVTAGQYAAKVNQISFIGTNYWALGKKLADESLSILNNDGYAYILTQPISTNTNYGNLLTSLQQGLSKNPGIKCSIIEDIDYSFDFHNKHNLFISLDEERTIKAAQILSDFYATKSYTLIGFGNNETCNLYLDKKIINELISLDPESIGQIGIHELFEYRSKGYANSYISADVKINRCPE